jgi:hypothetical protein
VSAEGRDDGAPDQAAAGASEKLPPAEPLTSMGHGNVTLAVLTGGSECIPVLTNGIPVRQ